MLKETINNSLFFKKKKKKDNAITMQHVVKYNVKRSGNNVLCSV